MSIDMYETRTMLAALEQMYPPKTFLLDTFFKEENVATTPVIDIDIVKGNRKIAQFVHSNAQARTVARAAMTTKTVRPPMTKEKMNITASDLMQRGAGQHVYAAGGSSLAQRAALQAGKDLEYLRQRVIRAEEYMAAQALDTGKIVIADADGYSFQLDFGMAGTHLPTASVKWDNASADPLTDLADWCEIIRQDSGMVPDICILGKSAWAEFLDNTKVQKILDLLRVRMGEISPSALPSGASYIGTITTPFLGLDFYSYAEGYTDNSGVTHKFVPDKHVWLGCSQARCVRQYGAIYDVKLGDVSTKYFPKTFETDDPSARWLMLQSAPCPSLFQVDAFLSATVLS